MIRRRHIAIYIEGGHIAPYHIVHIVFHTVSLIVWEWNSRRIDYRQQPVNR
jgi:hypothetical protein